MGRTAVTEDVPEEVVAEGSGPAAPEVPEVADDEAEVAALPPAMDDAQLERLVEALVFAADKPVTVQRLRQLTRVSDVRRIEQALATLVELYRDRGIALHHISGGYQMRTAT